MQVPPLPRSPGGSRRFLDAYTQGLTTTELERLFTRDAPEAYRFFSRAIGTYERLRDGGIALGMFEHATYVTGRADLRQGDVVVMYSDGITQAEDGNGQPFEEAGLQRVVDGRGWGSAKELGWATFAAIEHHTRERRLLDDLTVLVTRKLPPIPVAVAEGALLTSNAFNGS